MKNYANASPPNPPITAPESAIGIIVMGNKSFLTCY